MTLTKTNLFLNNVHPLECGIEFDEDYYNRCALKIIEISKSMPGAIYPVLYNADETPDGLCLPKLYEKFMFHMKYYISSHKIMHGYPCIEFGYDQERDIETIKIYEILSTEWVEQRKKYINYIQAVNISKEKQEKREVIDQEPAEKNEFEWS